MTATSVFTLTMGRSPEEGDLLMARPRWQGQKLQLTKAKHPQWFIWYSFDATTPAGRRRKSRREYFGYKAEVSERTAQKRRAAFLAKLNSGGAAGRSDVPLAYFVQVWTTRHVATLGAGTQRKYLGHLRTHILPAFGTKRLCDMETGVLQDWLNTKGQLSWATRADLRNIISGIFTKADEWGWWEQRNPAKYLKPGRKERARPPYLLSDEHVAAMEERCPPFLCLLINLLRVTGLRVSEALGLQEKHVRPGWLEISQRWSRGDLSAPKTEKSARDVPCPLDLSALFALDPEHFIFDRGDGRPWNDRDLMRRWIRPAAKAVGCYFPGMGFHTFRREVATRLQEAGASAIETANLLGHARPVMTQRYTVMQRARMEQLAKGLGPKVVEFRKESA